MSKTTIPAGGLSSASVTTAKIADDAVTAAKATGFGKIGQVLSVNGSTADAKTSTSYADITGMSLAITPTASSSKILILAKVNVLATGGGDDVGVRVQPLRGSTVLAANYSELYISDANEDPGTIGELKINYLEHIKVDIFQSITHIFIISMLHNRNFKNVYTCKLSPSFI